MTNLLKAGEIFVCSFPFRSGQFSKSRPVLVLFDFGTDVLICRITSKNYSTPFDVTVRHWQKAGLLKPSLIRLNRLVTAEKKLLVNRIGRLSPEDLQAIKSTWNRQLKFA
jgi:mRNA interferase MazF